jgi:hypothetical protein
MLPPAPNPPVRCAVSVIPAPIVTGPDAVVVRPGVALFTVEDSLASLQPVVTGVLFASPV